MSISGSLRDLTLIEFLQTLALSRKSGVLEVRRDDEVAWLGVRDGAVVRVALSARDLTRARVLTEAELDEKSDEAEISACLWDAATTTVLALLAWTDGEFLFEPEESSDAAWSGPAGLELPTALVPEFLALEGARRKDQAEVEADLGEPVAAAPEGEGEAADEPAPASEPSFAALIAVDPDLRLLESIKARLHGEELLVHVFQHPDDALRRAKQYFQRGLVPTIVVSEGACAADQDSRAGWRTLISRVRRMVPTVRIVLLRTSAGDPLGLANHEIERWDPGSVEKGDLERFLRELVGAVDPPA